ncbi:uncharacterized protein JCM6883_001081 [Sporobolomyces salmoneus]|uniref:uncharacterized protein n=1 Tax=Sporobolomyces salmoneus TaxID=183962 RepID=UPI003170919D
MPADWTDTAPTWQNPHERSYYRESNPPPSANVGYPNSFTGLSKETEEKHRRLQDSLDKVLGPEYVQNRPGGGGTKLTYLEGWRAINLANEVFGYNGWFTDIKYLEIDFCDYNPESGRWSMGVTAIVRVRLPDGASHEDIGYGKLENTKSKGDGLDKCKKEAVTDGLKRALRHFGKLLGNCLYDKAYLTQLSSMKATKPKFDWDSIYKPEHHALHAPLPKAIPPRAQVPSMAIDPASMPPPPPHRNQNLPGSTSNAPTTTNANDRPPPHPNHMQRAQTVGGSKPTSVAPAQRPVQQPQTSNNVSKPPPPAPQRAATVSYSSSTSNSLPPTTTTLTDRSNRADSVATSVGEYGLGSDDDSFFAAAMSMAEEKEQEQQSAGILGAGGDDSGFVEASFVQQESTKNAAPRPRVSSDQIPASTSNGSSVSSSIERKRAEARAKRDAKLRENAAAERQRQQQQQSAVGAGAGGGGTKTTAAQMLKNPLRPPVPPPARTASLNKPPTNVASNPPRQAGTLPTLNVGTAIVQAQQNAGGATTTNESSTGTSQGGFISAKRKFTQEPPAPGTGSLNRAQTISTSNPSSANRQPLGELDVTDSGQVKRFRASS